MPPNRKRNPNNHGNNQPQNGNNGQQQGNGNNGNGNQIRDRDRLPNNGFGSRPMKCVRPDGCLDPEHMIFIEDVESGDADVVKVICNNKQCSEGEYMHENCFVGWEDFVLNCLSNTGRARSWSVKQRQQNLWTKKGYDLVLRVCNCRCGQGHLQKDVHWVSPAEQKRIRNAAAARANNVAAERPQQANAQPEAGKKKKKSKAKENLPTLSLSAPVPHPNDNHSRKMSVSSSLSCSAGNGNGVASSLTSGHGGALGSFDSGLGIESPCTSASAWASFKDPHGILANYNGDPNDPVRSRIDSMSSECSGSSAPMSGTSGSPPSPGPQFGPSVLANAWKLQRKNSCPTGINSDRTRHISTGNGFTRRGDHSSFNVLPRCKVNSYNIKTEDDSHEKGDVGCIKNTILYNLSNNGMNTVSCCLCNGQMNVYDRYPLIDGTFFLSPRQHGRAIVLAPIPTSADPTPTVPRQPKYLNAICMHCLEGTTSTLMCRWCNKHWNGSDFILGGCYNYDIFAATPCCDRRRQCANCQNYVQIHPDRMFFSDFSLPSQCMRCGLMDFHFAKPVNVFFNHYTRYSRVF